MINYRYICVNAAGDLFCTVGNFNSYNKPKYTFAMSIEKKPHWIKTMHGYISNISGGKLPGKFKIIYQYEI